MTLLAGGACADDAPSLTTIGDSDTEIGTTTDDTPPVTTIDPDSTGTSTDGGDATQGGTESTTTEGQSEGDTSTTTDDGGGVCGNGTVEDGEQCEAKDLGGEDCESQGFLGGELQCGADCLFDTSGCTDRTCGNGAIDGTEQCDGTELGGATCQTEGFDEGRIACGRDCTLDTSGCMNAPDCGNDAIDAGETCDGTDLGGQTCVTQGFAGGTLGCAPDCGGFDTTACMGGMPACGDDTIDAGETCDGTDLGGQTCVTQGFAGGTLACALDCASFDTSACMVAGGGECCAAHMGPGCDDAACEAAVCAGDPFCCVTEWDATCATLATGEPACGDLDSCPPSGDDCCAVHAGTGCADAACEASVCGADAFCCNTAWDATCAAAATANPTCAGVGGSCPPAGMVCGNGVLDAGEACDGANLDGETCISQGFAGGGVLACEADCTGFDTTGCIAAGGGDCCAAHVGPGCDDAACEAAICGVDAFCCNTEWDDLCANAADTNPACVGAGGTCPPPVGGGDCCAAHVGPGCDDAACEAAICGADAFCCNTEWDDLCANAADVSPACVGAGGTCPPPVGGGGDCCAAHVGPGCDNAACEAAICGADAFCCDTEWDDLCANAADVSPACVGAGGTCPGAGGGFACSDQNIGNVTGAAVAAGTTVGADESLQPSCGGTGGPDHVMTWTATMAGIYTFNTFGSTYDTKLALYTDCATQLACNDDSGGGTQSQLMQNMAAGQQILIAVDGYNGATGNWTLNITPPGGGAFVCQDQDIGTMIGAAVATGTTVGADNDLDPTCGAGNALDRVIRFQAPAAGQYTFTTAGSAYDTVLALFSDCATQLACNDDTGGTAQSQLVRNMAANEVVLILVDGYNNATGNWTLNITSP